MTVTNRDPSYITPNIKRQSHRKNKLMWIGNIEEASALAQHIGKDITKRAKTQLSTLSGNTDSRKLWSCVRQLTGKESNSQQVKGITAVRHNWVLKHTTREPCPPECQFDITVQFLKLMSHAAWLCET